LAQKSIAFEVNSMSFSEANVALPRLPNQRRDLHCDAMA
jgi:hypothetical protein